MNSSNIYQLDPAALPTTTAELTELLASQANAKNIRIERIISPPNYASPPGTYYDQSETEFVLLLQGSATLEFPNENPPLLHLKPGDHLTINPHQKHRIHTTHHQTPTIWLTIFY